MLSDLHNFTELVGAIGWVWIQIFFYPNVYAFSIRDHPDSGPYTSRTFLDIQKTKIRQILKTLPQRLNFNNNVKVTELLSNERFTTLTMSWIINVKSQGVTTEDSTCFQVFLFTFPPGPHLLTSPQVFSAILARKIRIEINTMLGKEKKQNEDRHKARHRKSTTASLWLVEITEITQIPLWAAGLEAPPSSFSHTALCSKSSSSMRI